MWGNHLLDIYQHTSFNISFPHDLTRNPTRLIQWQYWWWFWFSSVFVLYYFLLSKIITKRSLKFKPKLVTSYRSHGRWGDIIVAVIPIFWCLNILSHSTLLLRMSEFQTETNILTIRVRGRQWYWVYKMEIENFFTLSNKKSLLNGDTYMSLTSNTIGGKSNLFGRHECYRQYWRNWFQTKYIIAYNNCLWDNELLTTETKLNDQEINKKLKDFTIKSNKIKNNWFKKTLDSNMGYINNNAQKTIKTYNFIKNVLTLKSVNNLYKNVICKHADTNNNTYAFKLINKKIKTQYNYNNFNNTSINYFYYFNNFKMLSCINEHLKINSNLYAITNTNMSNILLNKINGHNKEVVRYSFDLKPRFGFVKPKIEIFSPAENNINFFKKLPILMIQPDTEFETKNYDTTFKYFMVFDQHRRPINRLFKTYKVKYTNRTDKIKDYTNLTNNTLIKYMPILTEYKSFDPILTDDGNGNKKKIEGFNIQYSLEFIKSNFNFANSVLVNTKNKTIDFDFYSPIKYNIEKNFNSTQNNIKSKKKLIYNQRLLYTTSVLVLPTALNITVITNSYDVIHSWFIPGLGLKMDCVPGRSTHHTLYIDHPGLYYGQCAEICGRFHHHMPIKIAALHWEHFLLWWYHHTMNLGSQPLLKDYTKTAQKEFKNNLVYPITSKFTNTRPIV